MEITRSNRGSRGTGAPRPRRGQHIECLVQITLAEAVQGTTRLLNKDGRWLEVTIPPGVRTGSRVRLTGEGTPELVAASPASSIW